MATTGIRLLKSLGNAIGAAALDSLLSRVYEATTGGTMSTAAITDGHDALLDFVGSIDVAFGVAAAIMLVALFFATRLNDQTLTSSGLSSSRELAPTSA